MDVWVALGTGTDSAVSIPLVHNQELFQCFMHLLAAIPHQPSEVRAKYELGKLSRNMKSLHRFNIQPPIPLNLWIMILNTFKDLKEWLLSCMIVRPP